MKRAVGSGFESAKLADQAFNCRWGVADPQWSWKRNGEPDCIAWLHHIYFNGIEYNTTLYNGTYNGDCSPEGEMVPTTTSTLSTTSSFSGSIVP